jgi:hypothetical protein
MRRMIVIGNGTHNQLDDVSRKLKIHVQFFNKEGRHIVYLAIMTMPIIRLW